MSDSDKLVDLIEKLIKQLQDPTTANLIPVSQDDLNYLISALDQYKKDTKYCDSAGSGSAACYSQAQTKLMRALPWNRKSVYPWKNYDWDYGNFTNNNFSPMATGATPDGSIKGLFQNLRAFERLIDGYLFSPNPNDNSIAGNMDMNSDFDYWNCTPGLKDPSGEQMSDNFEISQCRATCKVKNDISNKPPTNDSFLTNPNYGLTGQNASSYFIKVGSCPRPDIIKQSDCSAKGYDWTPNVIENALADITGGNGDNGSCSQPRYAYIDNKPGFKIGVAKFQGIVPSIASDFLALTPDKLVSALMGQSIDGLFTLEPCPNVSAPGEEETKPETKEGFQNRKGISWNKFLVIFLLLIAGFLIYKYK